MFRCRDFSRAFAAASKLVGNGRRSPGRASCSSRFWSAWRDQAFDRYPAMPSSRVLSIGWAVIRQGQGHPGSMSGCHQSRLCKRESKRREEAGTRSPTRCERADGRCRAWIPPERLSVSIHGPDGRGSPGPPIHAESTGGRGRARPVAKLSARRERGGPAGDRRSRAPISQQPVPWQ